MAYSIRSFISPIRASFFSTTSVSGKLSLSRNCRPKFFKPIIPIYAPKYELMYNMQRKLVQSLNISGGKVFTGSFLGLSAAAGLMYNQPIVAYAMDDYDADVGEPSGFLKDDLHSFWSLARKFQLPIVLLMTVLMGWRNPITLVINIALLFICTKPSPSSIYMFIEQVRRRDMRENQRWFKSKFLYVKDVQVEDYKILCLAKVELRDLKLDVIGILGGWWVFQTSRI